MSTDTHGKTVQAGDASRTYIRNTNKIDVRLKEYVIGSMPQEAPTLISTYEVVKKEPDIWGCFTARATVWKLGVNAHLDQNDALCAILASGYYHGGEAVMPDLNARFR
jgi:hypothetical protein